MGLVDLQIGFSGIGESMRGVIELKVREALTEFCVEHSHEALMKANGAVRWHVGAKPKLTLDEMMGVDLVRVYKGTINLDPDDPMFNVGIDIILKRRLAYIRREGGDPVGYRDLIVMELIAMREEM